MLSKLGYTRLKSATIFFDREFVYFGRYLKILKLVIRKYNPSSPVLESNAAQVNLNILYFYLLNHITLTSE